MRWCLLWWVLHIIPLVPHFFIFRCSTRLTFKRNGTDWKWSLWNGWECVVCMFNCTTRSCSILDDHRNEGFLLLLALFHEPNNPQFQCTEVFLSPSVDHNLQTSDREPWIKARTLKWADWFVVVNFLLLLFTVPCVCCCLLLNDDNHPIGLLHLSSLETPNSNVKRLQWLALLLRQNLQVVKLSNDGFLTTSI